MKTGMYLDNPKASLAQGCQDHNDVYLYVKPTNPICGGLAVGYPVDQYLDTPPGFAAYLNK